MVDGVFSLESDEEIELEGASIGLPYSQPFEATQTNKKYIPLISPVRHRLLLHE